MVYIMGVEARSKSSIFIHSVQQQSAASSSSLVYFLRSFRPVLTIPIIYILFISTTPKLNHRQTNPLSSPKMAPIFKSLVLLSFSLLVAAQGKQFITGPCTSDADCQLGCCASDSGLCAARLVAIERGANCGFVPAGGVNNNQAVAPAPVAGPVTVKSTEGAGNQIVPVINPGGKFITSNCASDLECTAGCCAFRTGKCAGPVIAQERDGGCGFGNPTPNRDAADAFLNLRLGRRGPAMM